MLGYLISDGDGVANRLLSDLAVALLARGIAVRGVVQHNLERGDGRAADMDLQVLPHGPICRISQDLGPAATGCRLDANGLETAVGLVLTQIDGAEILILNRFGKQEADGRGFRPVIGEALTRGIPVILALRPDFLPAFETFSEGLGKALPNDPAALSDWFLEQPRRTRTI